MAAWLGALRGKASWGEVGPAWATGRGGGRWRAGGRESEQRGSGGCAGAGGEKLQHG